MGSQMTHLESLTGRQICKLTISIQCAKHKCAPRECFEKRESMSSCLKGQREGCTGATLEWGFRQDQFTPCLQEDKVIQGKSRAGEDELRRLAAALLGSTCVLSSCSLRPFSQAVISQASLVQEDIFFLLESLINFRSTCSESWQRCVSHLNKCLRCYFFVLVRAIFKETQTRWNSARAISVTRFEEGSFTKEHSDGGSRTRGSGNAFP